MSIYANLEEYEEEIRVLTEERDRLREQRDALVAAVPLWHPIATAPKNRTDVLVILKPALPDHVSERHAGRCFVALHPGVATDGFDMGWSLYPGYGGVPDEWIAGWMPLPNCEERSTVSSLLSRIRAEGPGPTREGSPDTLVQGVVFILVRAGAVLMERCPKKAARHGGEWFLPGGRIEGGEMREAALHREMAEELACTPGMFLPLPLADACGGPDRPPFLMQPYVVTHWVGDVPETCLDHPDVPLRWVPWFEALASPSAVVREMLTSAHSLLAQLGRTAGG